jgi:hypothetical protein
MRPAQSKQKVRLLTVASTQTGNDVGSLRRKDLFLVPQLKLLQDRGSKVIA